MNNCLTSPVEYLNRRNNGFGNGFETFQRLKFEERLYLKGFLFGNLHNWKEDYYDLSWNFWLGIFNYDNLAAKIYASRKEIRIVEKGIKSGKKGNDGFSL